MKLHSQARRLIRNSDLYKFQKKAVAPFGVIAFLSTRIYSCLINFLTKQIRLKLSLSAYCIAKSERPRSDAYGTSSEKHYR